ncbi:MAG: response regulator [Vicinamibacterales bacterium]
MTSSFATPVLSLSVLGHFSAILPEGREATIPTRKAQALLTYLALNPAQRFGRAHIAGLLWGDSVEALARNSLRQTLFTIRRALGPAADAALRIELDSVAINAPAVSVDVWDIERLLGDTSRPSLERAIEIYRGDLLAGFYLNEPGFDDWITAQRERLRVRVFEAMALLMRQQSDDNDLSAASRTAERLVGLDPLDEAAHRSLIRLHLRQGFRGAALRQYRACVEVLERELNVRPSPETVRLHDEILKQDGPALDVAPVPVSASSQAAAAQPSTILVVDDDVDHLAVLQHVLANEGYEVSTATDGASALSLLGGHRYDLVLVDIRMPGLDGLQLLEAIRKTHGDIPTVLMTARRGDQWELKSLELGASDYISKPFKTDVLLLRLKNQLKRAPGTKQPS